MSNFIDLTGRKFGRWTVLKRDEDTHKKNIHWICQCECGTVRSVAGTSLRSGISKSCGCEKDEKTSVRTKQMTDDLTGQRFGSWTVIERDLSESTTSKRGARWKCRCDCGNVKSVLGYSLRLGRTTSCGCKRSENSVIDLTGQRFGLLTVIERDEQQQNKSKGAIWKCLCDCGNITSVASGFLRSGTVRSCGCLRYNNENAGTQNLEGKRFGKWTVLKRDYSIKNQGPFYLCRCDCGNEKTISGYSLVKGFSTSCGCQKSIAKYDLTGQKFGKLTVLGIDESKKGNGIYWRCKCDCGNVKSFKTNHLKNGNVISCGCESRKKTSERRFEDLVGKRFGRLIVERLDHKQKDSLGNTESYWKCKCDCGNEIVVRSISLKRGDTKSCGCLQAEKSTERAKSRIIDLTGKRFGLLTVVRRVEKQEQGSNLGTWECLCDCGNIKLADGYYLRIGAITSCGCSLQSKYETYVIQYFNEKGYESSIDYECQKRFDDLRGYGERPLSYDFAVYQESKLKFLIECQGEQHYHPVEMFGGEEQFAKQQLHDEEKRNYAEKLGVKLIEIPYTANIYEKVKEYLVKEGV